MISQNDFPAPVLSALDMLNKNGADAYVVGGAVRDIIMGKNPKDFDIASSSAPSVNLKIFKDFKTIETGLKYGTVTVIIDGMPLEITTFRKDGKYKDFRKPESVTFGKSIEDDLKRRDFTVNALCYSPKTGLIDLFGGTEDIRKRTIRTISSPDKRFSEDALRILRALRFSSRLGFRIGKETSDSILKNKNLLYNISKERIRDELSKIITGENAADVLIKYREVIAVIIPEFRPCFDFNQKSVYHIYDVYTHIIKALDTSENDLTVRLAMLFHDIKKPACFYIDKTGEGHFKGHAELSAETAESILKRLRYDNKTIKNVSLLIKYHDIDIKPEKTEIKKWLGLLGEELLYKLFDIKLADSASKSDAFSERDQNAAVSKKLIKEITASGECYSLKDLDLNGNDLLSSGVPEKSIGNVLEEILSEVISERLENEKSVLLKYALNCLK